MAKAGHNGQLKAIVERIENLERDKAEIASDIRDVYAEAKGNGFDVKALRAIVRRRKQDAEKLAEHEAIVETYLHALGQLADLPLGKAAIKRDLQMDISERKDLPPAAPREYQSTADRPFGIGDDDNMKVAEEA